MEIITQFFKILFEIIEGIFSMTEQALRRVRKRYKYSDLLKTNIFVDTFKTLISQNLFNIGASDEIYLIRIKLI